MPVGADLAGAGEAIAFEDVGDRAVADASVEHVEDALHHRRCVGVRLEDAELDPGCGLRALRVGMSVSTSWYP